MYNCTLIKENILLSLRAAPVLAATLCGPDKNYAVSCQPRLKLLQWVSEIEGKKNNSQDFYLYLHSAEKGQLPSPDETVNPLDLKKVERVACRVSVQGGVSERVKWVGNLILFLCIFSSDWFRVAGKKFKGILFFRSGRPNVQGKAVTREATREAQLKRGGMKDRFEENLQN